MTPRPALHPVLAELVLALSVVLALGCGDDGPASTGASVGSGSGDDSGSSTMSGSTGGPLLDAPYGACAGEQASSECVDAGADVAQCLQRDDAQDVPYSTCALTCRDDGDCPAVGAGNVSPHCWGADDATPGLCLLDCYLDANSCASGTICVDGDPPICMWPGLVPGHPDAQSFCDTACGPCGATLLLPWPRDCVTECLSDLADCSEPEQQEIFACTGGEACPVGGAVVADCLAPIACVEGSA